MGTQKSKITLASRRSRLALAQSELVKSALLEVYPELEVEILEIVTTGDKQAQWSLEEKGGKGLFTKELELALLNSEADAAIHSAKDLPTEFEHDLIIAGYLKREDVADVFVRRAEAEKVKSIATGSPRRRAQGKLLYPGVVWSSIRGNIETRLKKVAKGDTDGTFLAAAGLKRLGIESFEGVELIPLTVEQMVPAVGQGAIAVQCRPEDVDFWKPVCDVATGKSLFVERMFLKKLGGGCHTAFGAHFTSGKLKVFHEDWGTHEFDIQNSNENSVEESLERIISQF